MLNIPLDEKYAIKADRRQYVLTKKCNGRWVSEGFFTDLQNLLRYYLDARIRASDARTVAELLDFQKSLVTSLNRALQPLKIEIRESETKTENEMQKTGIQDR